MKIIPLYWSEKGKYQQEADELYNQLVPDSDNCDTLEGELLRAITKLNYDAHNNGFCNNTSGPINFLINNVKLLEPIDCEIVTALKTIRPATNTGNYAPKYLYEATIPALDLTIDIIVQYIISKQGNYTPNTIDMYDYSDPDFYNESDDDYYSYL